MKLKADLLLVKQEDYVAEYILDHSECAGCVFYASSVKFTNSLCDRINVNKLTCENGMIYILDDSNSNIKGE